MTVMRWRYFLRGVWLIGSGYRPYLKESRRELDPPMIVDSTSDSRPKRSIQVPFVFTLRYTEPVGAIVSILSFRSATIARHHCTTAHVTHSHMSARRPHCAGDLGGRRSHRRQVQDRKRETTVSSKGGVWVHRGVEVEIRICEICEGKRGAEEVLYYWTTVLYGG